MNFEDAGKRLDKEIARLKVYLDKEVKPTTREEMARDPDVFCIGV